MIERENAGRILLKLCTLPLKVSNEDNKQSASDVADYQASRDGIIRCLFSIILFLTVQTD